MNEINKSYLEIKKSKFYSYLYEVNSEEDIKKIIETIKKDNKKAKHVVYAYTLNNQERLYNDKEPNGTTIGLLDALKRNNKNNYLIVVVRYFGGILLGSGPLTRTYSKVSYDLFK